MDEARIDADWYLDPSGSHQLRYWDGSSWTEHVADNGVQSTDPLPTPTEIAAQAVRAAEDAKRAAAEEAKAAAKAEKASASAAARAVRAEHRAEAAAERSDARNLERQRRASNPLALFGSAALRGGLLHYELKKLDMTEATAEATLGAPSSRTTLTRMGAGVLIAGPIGLVVGAVARKNTSKSYVTIQTPDGVIVIEGSAKDYPAAVKFADAVNRSTR